MPLKKALKLPEIFSIATGAMISSGIFILPGLAFAMTGPSEFVSYFIAGLLAFAGVLSVSELATAMPKAGGDYFFINRSLGASVGTISGLLSWFALSLKSAFGIIGIMSVAKLFFTLPSPTWSLVGIVITLFFVSLNITGVKEAGKFQVALVVILISIMLIYIVGGISSVHVQHFEPFTFNGGKGVLIAAGFVFVSYGGLIKVASMSEEITNPKRNIPLGLISSLVVTIILYTGMLIVTVGIENPRTLADPNNLTPIANAAKLFLGNFGFYMILIASMLAFITTANAGIMSASRYPLAMSRDNLMPKALGFISPKLGTPTISLLITGGFIIFAILLPLDILIKAASTVVIMNYILSNLSVIILRESKIQNYRPSFKAPLYPWTQILAIFAFIMLIFDMGLYPILISFGLIIFGFFVYLLYGKKKEHNEYAFLHLIERVMNKKLTSYNLEGELKSILYERDDITKDKFDTLIEDAEVMDITDNISIDQLFSLIAEHLEKELTISKEDILRKLHDREQQASTALTPFVAIPHLIVEKEDSFEIILIRSKQGIKFSEDQREVKAIFVLAGSMSERNIHLKSLSAIAQIVQNKEFEKKWINASRKKNLKDIILLGERRRF
jgi:amino acid transporter/mannitol/fructose-specific phosphotransferase system IIA component (Ntr-type)